MLNIRQVGDFRLVISANKCIYKWKRYLNKLLIRTVMFGMSFIS
jgi:hypothetical protein